MGETWFEGKTVNADRPVVLEPLDFSDVDADGGTWSCGQTVDADTAQRISPPSAPKPSSPGEQDTPGSPEG